MHKVLLLGILVLIISIILNFEFNNNVPASSDPALPPVFLMRVLYWITTGLEEIKNAITPSSLRLLKPLNEMIHLQPLYVSVRLNIPDILENGPLTIEQIAERANIPNVKKPIPNHVCCYSGRSIYAH
jgi:hypothetical protein